MERIALYSLWIFFVAEFTRALPWPKSWKAKRPLTCHACMAGWILIGLSIYGFKSWQSLVNGDAFILMAAAGGAVLLMELRRYWRGLEPPEG